MQLLMLVLAPLLLLSAQAVGEPLGSALLPEPAPVASVSDTADLILGRSSGSPRAGQVHALRRSLEELGDLLSGLPDNPADEEISGILAIHGALRTHLLGHGDDSEAIAPLFEDLTEGPGKRLADLVGDLELFLESPDLHQELIPDVLAQIDAALTVSRPSFSNPYTVTPLVVETAP